MPPVLYPVGGSERSLAWIGWSAGCARACCPRRRNRCRSSRSELAYSPSRRWSRRCRRPWSTSTPPRRRARRSAACRFRSPACRRTAAAGAELAGLGRAGEGRRADRHQRPCRAGRRRDPRRAGRPARVRRQAGHARTTATTSPCCASTAPARSSRSSSCAIPIRSRSATSCWRSAIRSAWARP